SVRLPSSTFFCLTLLLLPSLFFFNDPATTELYTLSLHDALPICFSTFCAARLRACAWRTTSSASRLPKSTFSLSQSSSRDRTMEDRKSTRLNSSHVKISYAVFCLKKKNKKTDKKITKT